jgi:hypothetical protein
MIYILDAMDVRSLDNTKGPGRKAGLNVSTGGRRGASASRTIFTICCRYTRSGEIRWLARAFHGAAGFSVACATMM